MILETATYFIENQASFGAYPTQDQIELLEKWGVDTIIDLTNSWENKIFPYYTKKKVIKFPIPDRKIPINIKEFCVLVVTLSEKIDNGEKIFIHCKGGHGRAGILVAALLCFRNKITPIDALQLTSEYHSRRINIRLYWKKIGSPQTQEQKQFISHIFKDHYITDESPFKNPYESYIDSFLIQTNLGHIIGQNGEQLETRRKHLFLNNFYNDWQVA